MNLEDISEELHRTTLYIETVLERQVATGYLDGLRAVRLRLQGLCQQIGLQIVMPTSDISLNTYVEDQGIRPIGLFDEVTHNED